MLCEDHWYEKGHSIFSLTAKCPGSVELVTDKYFPHMIIISLDKSLLQINDMMDYKQLCEIKLSKGAEYRKGSGKIMILE